MNLPRKHPTRLLTSISLLTLAISLTACGGGGTDQQTTGEGGGGESQQTAKSLPIEGRVSLTGSGASFPNPLYQRWFQDFNKEEPRIKIDYQQNGSGAGVRQFTEGVTDFGASDVAMTDKEIDKVDRGVLLLPMTAGSIVLSYNLPGVEGLKLTREAYVDIFLGKITNWDDRKIADVNPDIELPNKPITVVHRSDASGTTGVFTQHLSEISPEWKESIGTDKSVQWPKTGTFIGAPRNDGVTQQIRQNEGSIGYIEYGYAKIKELPMAALENKSGNFIEPSDDSAAATLSAVTLPENLRAFITDPEGPDSYPIVTYTWMLVYKQYDDKNKAVATEAMIEYGLTKGQEKSQELGYIPLPPNVVKKVAAVADQISPDYEITVN